MKSIFYSFVLSLTFCSTAFADINNNGVTIDIYIPRMQWKMVLPSTDWELLQKKSTPDGSGFYYNLSSESTLVNFSVFFEKTNKCKSSDQCMDLFWSNPGKGYENASSVTRKSVNDFSVLEFYIDKPMGQPFVQSNLSAHQYRDGYWIDIHLSKVDSRSVDYSSMYKILSSLKFEDIAAADPSNQSIILPNHGIFNLEVPAGWQIKTQQPPDNLPPTISLSNGKSVFLITPIWGQKGKALNTSDAQMRQLVEASGMEMLPNCVEKTLRISKIQGQNVKGYYSTLTDKAPKPDEFKYGTTSVIALNDLLISATYLSNLGDISDFMAIIGTFRETHK